MSLSTTYQKFLASPSADALAEHASLNYITTLTTINDSLAILKHLTAQAKQLNKKEEKTIGAVEGNNGLCLDVETTLEFVSGGGAYLPGLDDNFLADRVVIFPVVHIVNFDSQQKITQIRLYWDQGSLLKQVDVIGSRAKNWPIRDGKDQARLIAKTANDAPSSASSRRSTTSRDDVVITSRPQSSRSNISATNDPHASLDLFQPRDANQDFPIRGRPNIAPRASAKPPSRDLTDILAGHDSPPPSSEYRSPSPQKDFAPKGGAGKNYHPIRLFEKEDVSSPQPTERSTKTNPKKFQHFEFGNGEDQEATPKDPKRSVKHQSQWNFEDFVTPQKAEPKVRSQEVRHFGWSDDEEQQSPVHRPVVHQPRPSAKTHFDFVDDGTPEPERRALLAAAGTGKGRMHNDGLGLYKDHVVNTEEKEESSSASKKPLNNITTTVNNESRANTFGAHWDMTDDSPSATREEQAAADKGIAEDRKKVLKGMDANWGLYDESPNHKENNRGIKTSSNGMGGRKGAKPSWGFGDESDEEAEKPTQTKPKAGAVRNQTEKSFWDF